MRQAHKHVLAPGSAIAALLLLTCNCLFALNPALDISQYAHTSWKNRRTNSIIQTPDGYLWLGTEFGLLRFDGVRSVEWAPPGKKQLPSNDIRKLLVSRDGRLWIGTSRGLASWKDYELIDYAELAGSPVLAILEDSQGTTWAGETSASAGRLCAIHNGKIQCYGQDGGFGQGVPCLYEYKGSIWAGAANGLWRWTPGSPTRYALPDPPDLHDLVEGEDGALWIANRGGLERLVHGQVGPYPLRTGQRFNPSRLLRDRDGGLWIGTYGQGLIHVHQGRADVFTSADGLSADFINGLLEDREGNIWIATLDGFDRFREVAVADVSFKQQLSGVVVYSVLPASDGSVWLATSDGLKRWKDGQVTIYRKRGGRSTQVVTSSFLQQAATREIEDNGLPDNALGSLFQDSRGRVWVSTVRGIAYFDDGKFVPVGSAPGDVVHAIAQDRTGTLWIANQSLGLFGISPNKETHQIPWPVLGRNDYATALAADPLQGGLWVGFRQGGVIYFADGGVRASYSPAAGFGEGFINDLQADRDGTLWVATDKGLGRLKNGRFAALTRENGLPCDRAHWIIEDDANSFWLSMACGLVRIGRGDLEAWSRSVDGSLNKQSREKWAIRATVFDISDGAKIRANASGFSPHVSKSPDGRLWSAFLNGVSVVDGRHLPSNNVRPPVHIERIIADDKSYDFKPGTRLPANVRNLRIEYTALSLVAPEKIHFKYKLEGQNGNWHEVVNERYVQYTNLGPRNYSFHVIASNNSDVWNETGDTLEFSIAPAWNQTTWFFASCLAAFLATLWGLYRVRLYQIEREFNAQLEGRVDERLRVARDLHDTLLQTFQAALIQMQAGYNLLSRRPEKAAEAIEKAITTSAGAIAEGREAIHNMRSSAAETNDLVRALRIAGDQMAAEGSARFDVKVQGSSRDVHPILRDEVYRIALEALRNAFKHAEAKTIEAEIVYGDSLRVRIRDDGKGIDPAVMDQGKRPSHYGLPGMRERAESIGGKLDVWTGPDVGTEIQLSIPGTIAFGRSGAGSLLRRFRSKGKTEAAGQT